MYDSPSEIVFAIIPTLDKVFMQTIKLNSNNSKEVVQQATDCLEKGGLVIYPTETCYGAGVLATNQKAVDKLLKYKKRPHGKAITIAVTSKEMAKRYVDINPSADSIYDKFLPGPVTVVSDDKGVVARGLATEYSTLGVRIPDYKLILNIVKELDTPITATSANSSGKKTPYTIDDILDNLSDRQKSLIDLIIDAGELPRRPSSTVIDTTKSQMQILRKGDTSIHTTTQTITIKSDEQMQNLGAEFIKEKTELIANKCLVVLFNAELGAGKTQFVKGLAKELGIEERVKSPTYSLMEEYEYKLSDKDAKLVHMDAWRLESIEEFGKLHIDKLILPSNVIVIEWAGNTEGYFVDLLKQGNVELIKIDIDYLDEVTREVRIYE